MIIALIPSRLNSKRLKEKPLIELDGIPLIVHCYNRVKLSKKIDKVFVCTDSNKIKKVVEENGGDAILTSKKHKNGTERINEVAKKLNARLILDVQGDEPLINPKSIDKVINFHLKNKKFDIILPSVPFDPKNDNKNIVKNLFNYKKEILYLSRSLIPLNNFNKRIKYFKHSSIISFTKKALNNFCKLKQSPLEIIEGVELLRAVENNFKIGTFILNDKSFSVDVNYDLLKAMKKIKKDPIRKLY